MPRGARRWVGGGGGGVHHLICNLHIKSKRNATDHSKIIPRTVRNLHHFYVSLKSTGKK